MGMTRVLCILAHPDDEVLWAYPVLQAEYEVGLLTVCRNAHKGGGPAHALAEVACANDITLFAPPLQDNQFYRLPTRYAHHTLPWAVERIQTALGAAIERFRPDVLFTHNPWGEYGHGDHRLVFNVVAQYENLWLADMCQWNRCHVSSDRVPAFYRPWFQEPMMTCHLDERWYERMKEIYLKHKAWTWGGHEPVRQAGLYAFGKGA